MAIPPRLRASVLWLATQLVRQPLTIQLLRSLSILVVLYHERWVFVLYARSCTPPNPGREADVELVLLADPQLIDRFTYPALSGLVYPIVRWASDSYNSKAWRALNPNLRTPWSLRQSKERLKRRDSPERKGVIWVGDLFDGSRREMNDERWNSLVARFERLFPSSPPSLFIPGNHDMGLPLVGGAGSSAELDRGHIAVDPRARQRFLQSFGTPVEPASNRAGGFVAASVSEPPSVGAAGSVGKRRSVNARVPLYVSCVKGADGEEGSCPLEPTHEIILLDALDLVGIESVLDRQRHVTTIPGELPGELVKLAREQFTETYDFVESLAKDARKEGGPMRILIQHVPLFRPATTSCHLPPSLQAMPHGVKRESKYDGLRQGADSGGTYQNEVGKEVSDWVLSKIRPSVVFSGDDHDHCEVLHLLPGTSHSESDPTTDKIHNLVDLPINVVPELTLKAFSITEGVRRPGFARLSLYAPISGLQGGGIIGHDEGEAGSNEVDIADAAGASSSASTSSFSAGSMAGSSNVPRLSYTPCLLPDQLGIWTRSYPLFILLVLALLHLARRTGHRLPSLGLGPLSSRRGKGKEGLLGGRGKSGKTSLAEGSAAAAGPRQVRLGMGRSKSKRPNALTAASLSSSSSSRGARTTSGRMDEWEMVDVEGSYGVSRGGRGGRGGRYDEADDERSWVRDEASTSDEEENEEDIKSTSGFGGGSWLRPGKATTSTQPSIRFGGVLGSATAEAFQAVAIARATFAKEATQVISPALILWSLLQLD